MGEDLDTSQLSSVKKRSPRKSQKNKKSSHHSTAKKKDPNDIRFGMQQVQDKEDTITYEPVIDLNKHRLTAVKLNKYARSIERKQLSRNKSATKIYKSDLHHQQKTESSPVSKSPNSLPVSNFRKNRDLEKKSFSNAAMSVKMFEEHNKGKHQFSFIPSINRRSAMIASKIVKQETSIHGLNHFKLNLG